MKHTAPQLTLFPVDLLGQSLEPPKKKTTQAKGYAGKPGRGPLGETCRSCLHYRRVGGGRRAYPKCALCWANWTHGPGSDIRAKSPACQFWKQSI